jgi:hypothetical protein
MKKRYIAILKAGQNMLKLECWAPDFQSALDLVKTIKTAMESKMGGIIAEITQLKEIDSKANGWNKDADLD